MTVETTNYALRINVAQPFAETLDRTREELSKEGFGVLTEIDVRATFKQKLNENFRPYTILGACNPPLAHEALSADRYLGLLLPCNVIVFESDQPETTVVAAIDPIAQFRVTGDDALEPIAREVRDKLMRVLEGLSANVRH